MLCTTSRWIMVIMRHELHGAVKVALAPVSDEMLQSTPSLGQLVDSIHGELDVDRLGMVYVGFSMKDARQLFEDGVVEACARTSGQMPADLQRGHHRALDWHLNVQMQTLAFQARVPTRRATTPTPALLITKREFQRRVQKRFVLIASAILVSAWMAHLMRARAPRRRVVLWQTDPWRGPLIVPFTMNESLTRVQRQRASDDVDSDCSGLHESLTAKGYGHEHMPSVRGGCGNPYHLFLPFLILFFVCCPVHVCSDSASSHVVVSPHPHSLLAQVCAEKSTAIERHPHVLRLDR